MRQIDECCLCPEDGDTSGPSHQENLPRLFDAFTELLEEHRFEDLTVAMLCDRAMIRRTTFYKHFRDKNDYFAFYIDELMSGLPQKQPDEAGAVSAEDVRALRHAILDDAMDLILAHEQLMDNILASSMSGMLTNVICDRIARSIRERVMNVLAEDALAPRVTRDDV